MVAGDVPVQLVEILEVADLPVGAIGDLVGVDAVLEKNVALAEIDALSVTQGLGVPRFALAIAFYRDHVERHMHALAMAVAIAGWKVAVDAPANLVAFGPHTNRLRDIETCICREVNVGVIVENPLIGKDRARGRQREYQQSQSECDRHP